MSVNRQDIQSLLDKAKEALKTSSYEEAKELFANAQQLLDALEDKESNDTIALQADIENGLSEIAWSTGNNEQALERAEKALALSITAANKMMEGNALQNIGNVYLDLSDYPKALEFFQRSLAINEEIGNKTGITSCLNNIGRVYFVFADYPKALVLYQNSLGISEEIKNKESVGSTLNNIGGVYSSLSDYRKALEFYQKALDIKEEIGDKRSVAAILGNIGIVYSYLSDYPKAFEFYQKALSIFEEMGNKLGVADTFNNIGEFHSDLQDYPKALEFFRKAQDIHKEIRNKVGGANALGNIGLVYSDLKDYPKALEFYQKAQDIHEEIGNKNLVAISLVHIGRVLMKLSPPDYTSSEETLKEALTLNRSLGTRNQEVDCLESLSELYRLQERWQQADEFYQIFHEVSSEIFSLEAKKQADNFAIQREIQEQEKEQAVEQASKLARHQATESLLQRVLPAQIAERILDGEEQIADYHASTSILFADIQGFTALTADLPPYLLLQLLHDIFTRFDALTKAAGCTKIKTIGDGYMVVAGAPETCEDHAERIVQLALQMIEPIEFPTALEAFLPEEAELKIRVGIHVGPIVAGVIGQDAFSYDIYSDAVNVASRMESTGEAQRIHVSAGFMRHLLSRFAMTKNTEHGISFEKRGEIQVKGKGTMKTFFLCP